MAFTHRSERRMRSGRRRSISCLPERMPSVPMSGRIPARPKNKWTALDHSLDWSACFLWEYGERNEPVCALCPETAAALEALPRNHIPGRAPSAFFSILKAGAHIPPHTGVTNTRAIVHLPLIVPPGCGFRVGGETREWTVGQAFAFDDTIEHEAWNRSDRASHRADLRCLESAPDRSRTGFAQPVLCDFRQAIAVRQSTVQCLARRRQGGAVPGNSASAQTNACMKRLAYLPDAGSAHRRLTRQLGKAFILPIKPAKGKKFGDWLHAGTVRRRHSRSRGCRRDRAWPSGSSIADTGHTRCAISSSAKP